MLLGDDPEAVDLLVALMRDADERPHLLPLVSGQPVTDQQRRAYAAWLQARGEVRGEVLALAVELAASAAPDPAAQARLEQLLTQVSPAWWTLARTALLTLNCGAARDRPAPVRFAFACPMAWEQLVATDDPRVRHCGRCDHDVHRVDTTVAAEAHARLGHCIAVPGRLTQEHRDQRLITGRPAHPAVRWAETLFGPIPPDQR